ncbi:bifunctional DNA primase/polymerase [Streptacidiphilus sp. EB103A]|uniref:bifunctional DNA primase/polymerase n=1 Tax=Streptacidiphilus sp. EB103A TaxID=3156275 RepID=UPI003515F1D9
MRISGTTGTGPPVPGSVSNRKARFKSAMEGQQTGTSVHSRSLDVALWWARRDWPVWPLSPLSKRPAPNCGRCQPRSDGSPAHPARDCGCIEAGRWCHAFHAATTSPERIHQWWTHNPAFGVSISTGPGRLLVLDVDRHAVVVPERSALLPGINIPASVDLTGLANGFHTLALLAALRGQRSPTDDDTTLRVATPQHGMHVYYRLLPTQPDLRSSVGTNGTVALAWQVDVKAMRSSIVAPGTMTRSGGYLAYGTARMPAPAPDWLIDELLRTGHADRAPRPMPELPCMPAPRSPRRGTVPAATRLASLLEDIRTCANVATGFAFTEKLNRAAFTAGGLIAAGTLDHHDAVALLQSAAQHARPHHRQITAIINSGIQAGASRPFQD